MERILKIFSVLILIFISTPKGISQEWNAARISVLYGSSIPFNFNTLDKIKNGIEITTGTLLGISLADSNQVGHDLEGFVLNFRSFNGQPNIKGDLYTLPLDRIRVKAESTLGLADGISLDYQDLSTDWTTLFSYDIITSTPWINMDWANYQLNISYECGKPVSGGGNGSLLGEESDYYNVEIEFELLPTGIGF